MVGELSSRGHRTRALIGDTRRRDLVKGAEETAVLDPLEPGEELEGALDGVEIVFSAAGRPCTLRRIPDRRSFGAVDHPINRALLDAALGAGVKKFGYVTAPAPKAMCEGAYVGAREEFVRDLKAARIEHRVVRANGFFYS